MLSNRVIKSFSSISAGNADGTFVEKNACISSDRIFALDSVSLPRLDNPTGACPAHRRQWADFLAALTVLPHRQYKTARTETRCHLLLKIWQMAIQTSASRDYVIFGSAQSATRKFLNCLMICGHSPWIAQNLGIQNHYKYKICPLKNFLIPLQYSGSFPFRKLSILYSP